MAVGGQMFEHLSLNACLPQRILQIREIARIALGVEARDVAAVGMC